MYTAVVVPSELRARHSLCVREKPDSYYRTPKLLVRAAPKSGMAIDTLKLHQLTDPCVEKFADTCLAENPVLTEEQVAYPTCEMPDAYFFTPIFQAVEELDASAELKSVEVELRELEGKEWRGSLKGRPK